MTHAFVLLGKHGDILSALPILCERFKQAGEKQNLVVAREYRSVADRASYVNVVEWPGKWGDLAGALRFAKRSFDHVTCLSTYGDDFPVQKRLPGFQLDQWDRAGALDRWDKLECKLTRGPAIMHMPGTVKPMILFGDYSESSPFPHADELAAELTKQFPEHQVLRLSTVRVDNPCDLLALFHEADVLVSVETMWLHLCKFSPVPTVALVTDKPSRWRGTSWSDKFRLHVRYSDYEQRKSDILQAVRDAVNKVESPKIEPMIHTPPLAYNPSILRVGDKAWTSWRHHPEQESWRTVLTVHDGEKARPIRIQGFEPYSQEDARLFMFQGKPHISFTLARSPLPGQNFGPCVTGYAELRRVGEIFDIAEFHLPKFGHNDWSGTEKNLVFFERDEKLFCIWQCAPEQIVLGLDGSQVVSIHKSATPECPYGSPRGGTQPLPFKDKWIRFVHVNQRNPKSDQYWTYMLFALVMEPTPPFQIVAISKRPILIGNEQYFPNHRHWKPRCILPFGAVEENGVWYVAIGVNDSQCASVKLTEKDLHL